MEIEGAVAQLGKDARRHDFGGHERNQPRPPQLIETERSKVLAGLDRHHRKTRIVPEQRRTQHRPLGHAGQKNNDIEHAFRGFATAVWLDQV